MNLVCLQAFLCQDFRRLPRLKDLSPVAVVAGLTRSRRQMFMTLGMRAYWCVGRVSKLLIMSVKVVTATG